MRSVGAAMRAAEREAQRNHKIALKARMTETSAEAVAALDEYLENLISLHADLANAVDWNALANQPQPTPPSPSTAHQDKTARTLVAFKPSPLDVLRGGSWKRRAKLEEAHKDAIRRDQEDFDRADADYRATLSDWKSDIEFARRVLDLDAMALRDIISEMKGWADEGRIGSRIDFEIDAAFLHAKPVLHSDDIVPKVRRKQLASGRLSETRMPSSQTNELYQDYVASVALRIAGDLFNLTPLPELYVTCLSDMLDKATGHKKAMPILSVHFVRETFSRLNLANLDPSDAMSNFRHHIKFGRSRGFEPIEQIVANRT